jgi:hypothetical protein
MSEQVRVVFVYIRCALVLGKLSVKSFLGSQFGAELRLVPVQAIGRVVTVLNLVDGVPLLLPESETNQLWVTYFIWLSADETLELLLQWT